MTKYLPLVLGLVLLGCSSVVTVTNTGAEETKQARLNYYRLLIKCSKFCNNKIEKMNIKTGLCVCHHCKHKEGDSHDQARAVRKAKRLSR